jgi:hypothetical protein
VPTIRPKLSRLDRAMGTGRLFHNLAPGYSHCGRCLMPWKFADGHDTPYSPTAGCFPLCEDCWEDLETPEARMPYYRRLILEVWEEPELWPAVEESVRAGN